MKTGIEVILDVRSLISISDVTSAITGKIYEVRRPTNSKLIDIVIGVQGVDNNWMQQALLNVNINVPNLASDSTMPDLRNLNNISKLLVPLLDGQNKSDFYTKVDAPAIIYQDTDGTFYANIKVKYFSVQTNHKNI